jgi:hypothetical protein
LENRRATVEEALALQTQPTPNTPFWWDMWMSAEPREDTAMAAAGAAVGFGGGLST